MPTPTTQFGRRDADDFTRQVAGLLRHAYEEISGDPTANTASIRDQAADVMVSFYDDRPLTPDLLAAMGFKRAEGRPYPLYVLAFANDKFVDGECDLEYDPGSPVSVPHWSLFTEFGGRTRIDDLIGPRTVGDLRWLCWKLNIQWPIAR